MRAKPFNSFVILFAGLILTGSAWAVTFSEAIETAKRHSEYKINSLTLEQSHKQKQKAYLSLAPSLSLSSSRSASPDPQDFSATSWGVDSSLNLFAGFSDLNNIRGTRAGNRAAAALRQSQNLEQELTVGQIYLECLFYQTSEGSASSSHQVGTQVADIAKKRFERGLTSKDEYLKLKIDAETSLVKYITEKSKKGNCYANLKYWIGNFGTLENVNFKEATGLLTFAGFPEMHPKFIYQKEVLSREEYYSRVLLAKSLPQINLDYSRDYKPLQTEPETTWMVRGTWTIFDSGQNWTNTQIQNIELEKASEKLRSVEKTLVRDSESFERTYLDNLKIYTILESNLSQIKSTFRTSLNRFRAGATTANDVALDQSRVIGATYALDNMWLQKHLSLIRYQNSLGKSVTELLR